MSAVAGIVDANGGIRVVVSELENMHNHLEKGEKLYLLSEYVEEPVPYNEVPSLINRVRRHIEMNK